MLCQSPILSLAIKVPSKRRYKLQNGNDFQHHLFLDHCLIYSVTVQNKPAPFLLLPSCVWKVKWKWSTVLGSVLSSEWMRLFPHPSKPQLSLLVSPRGETNRFKVPPGLGNQTAFCKHEHLLSKQWVSFFEFSLNNVPWVTEVFVVKQD